MSLHLIKQTLYRLLALSETGYWADLRHHDEAWTERTRLMSRYLQAGQRILEFGVGRGDLKEMLPQGCTYISSDITPRSPEVFVCDLNQRKLPELPAHDVAFLSGVLEHLHHPERVISTLAKISPHLLLSYPDLGRNPGKRERQKKHYYNHLHRRKLLTMIESAGFELIQESVWETHGIHFFKNRLITG
jgi:2-polyprenyl-3-methyl-5-hydroxy-6-metoxy-1,4-benzoquinol methylase